MLSVLAIGGDIDGAILLAQGLRNFPHEHPVIFDQKNFHSRFQTGRDRMQQALAPHRPGNPISRQ
jgi:hypothetical protein